MEAVVDDIRPHEIPEGTSWLARKKREVRRSLIELGLLSAVDPREGWIVTLLEDVKVKLIPGSNVLQVRYSHDDPRLLAALMNSMMRAYIAHHLHVYGTPGIETFYESQVESAKEKLESLTADLVAYRTNTAALVAGSNRASVSLSLNFLREATDRYRGELIDLETRYSAEHIKVTAARAKLAGATAEIAKMEKVIESIEDRDAAIRTKQSLIDSQRIAYLDVLKQWEQAKTDQLANPSTTNVRVVQYSNVPTVPLHPRLFYIAIATVIGFILAVAIALLREYFDQRVSHIDIAEATLGLPVFGAIPHHKVRTRS